MPTLHGQKRRSRHIKVHMRKMDEQFIMFIKFQWPRDIQTEAKGYHWDMKVAFTALHDICRLGGSGSNCTVYRSIRGVIVSQLQSSKGSSTRLTMRYMALSVSIRGCMLMESLSATSSRVFQGWKRVDEVHTRFKESLENVFSVPRNFILLARSRHELVITNYRFDLPQTIDIASRGHLLEILKNLQSPVISFL